MKVNLHQLERLLANPQLVKWLGVGLFVGGLFIAALLCISDPEGLPRRTWGRYVAYLERKLRQMFIWTPGDHIALGQVGALFASPYIHLLIDLPYWYIFEAIAFFGPALYIEYLRRKRVTQIEEQLDGFILALANALKATPSIADAFISVQKLIANPMRQEVELACKEMRLGSTLEQALLFMAGRIGSRQVDSALATVLIGRQIGGNLPKILETTAAAIREMARLEGVVRTKTAEGKAQLWVLALAPGVIVYAFNKVQPDYFGPLTRSLTGYLCLAIAMVLWLTSLLVARKILNVDI